MSIIYFVVLTIKSFTEITKSSIRLVFTDFNSFTQFTSVKT